jgi:hypothetical protein
VVVDDDADERLVGWFERHELTPVRLSERSADHRRMRAKAYSPPQASQSQPIERLRLRLIPRPAEVLYLSGEKHFYVTAGNLTVALMYWPERKHCRERIPISAAKLPKSTDR